MTTTCIAPIIVNDIGTVFRATITECVNGVDTPVDVSLASTQEFTFRKPDGSALGPVATSFTIDGTDGQIQYTTLSGDLDQTGIWTFQARVVLGTAEFRTSIATFEVGVQV